MARVGIFEALYIQRAYNDVVRILFGRQWDTSEDLEEECIIFNLLKDKLNLKDGLESQEIGKRNTSWEATREREQRSQLGLWK